MVLQEIRIAALKPLFKQPLVFLALTYVYIMKDRTPIGAPVAKAQMGNSIYFGTKTPAKPHLIRPRRGLSGEVFDLRGDIDEAFTSIESSLGSAIVPSENTRYVNKGVATTGDGTQSTPFKTIQEAIDELELLAGAVATVIYIEPGEYSEALVIHQPSMTLVSKTFTSYTGGPANVWINPPADQWALTLTNATPESLTAYDISGNYSDLINQGNAGPQYNKFKGLYFYRNSDDAGLVRLLGVKGDISSTQTNFGWSVAFEHLRIFHTGAYPNGVYARNSGDVSFNYTLCDSGKHRLENSFRFYYKNSSVPDIHHSYDNTDPNGQHRYAHYPTIFFENSDLLTENDDTVITHTGTSGGAYFTALDSFLGFRNFGSNRNFSIVGNAGYMRLHKVTSLMDIEIGANLSFTAKDTTIIGNLELNSGPGTANLEGGGITGELTDPDEKLTLTPTKRSVYPSTATGTTTAKTSERLRYNTSGGTFTINAPASPITGDGFAVKEIVGDLTDITVSGNGNNIEHPLTGVIAATAVFGQARISVTWEFDGTDWITI